MMRSPRHRPRRRSTDEPVSNASSGKSFVAVTGAAGFLARYLIRRLLEEDEQTEVLALDLVFHELFEHPRVLFHKLDVCSASEVAQVFADHDIGTVFHTSSLYRSFGESGLVWNVNVEGTKNMLAAAKANNVRHFIYTSSNNLMFAGKEVIQADEYDPPVEPIDLYTRSKKEAEQLVLQANHPNANFYTVAIRPGGLYGVGERHHAPRVANTARIGLLMSRVGSHSATMDFCYVKNAVQGHMLAYRALSASNPSAAVMGKAFYITDEEPVTNWELWKPICETMKYRYPRFYIPGRLMYYFCWMMELLHGLFSRWIDLTQFPMFFTRAEILKLTVTNTCSTARARQHLHYKPLYSLSEALRETCTLLGKRYKLGEEAASKVSTIPPLWLWVGATSGMLLTYLLYAFPLSHTVPHPWLQIRGEQFGWFGTYVMENVPLITVVWWFAAGYHVIAALYALLITFFNKYSLLSCIYWGVQTLFTGTWSIMLLRKRTRIIFDAAFDTGQAAC